jgi:hypothetical protein
MSNFDLPFPSFSIHKEEGLRKVKDTEGWLENLRSVYA